MDTSNMCFVVKYARNQIEELQTYCAIVSRMAGYSLKGIPLLLFSH